MKVSVVIPARNEAARLPLCLDALARQTLRPHEVIVVDNGSTDDTTLVASGYDFVRVIQEPQVGRVYARNTGFRAASGDVLARIDADSIVPDNWLAWVGDYYRDGSHDRHALTGGAYFYNMRPAWFISWAYNVMIFRFNQLLIGYPTLWGSNMAIPRSLWKKVQNQLCLDNALHEDLDITIHIRKVGGKIKYDSMSRVRVEMRRIHTDQQSLWPYLQMWPRTLRRHGYQTWIICWVVGAAGLFIASQLLRLLPAKDRE